MSYSDGSHSLTAPTTTIATSTTAIPSGTIPASLPFLVRQVAQAALPAGVPHDYIHKPIRGDGNCLFRAVAVGLGLREDEHLLIRDVALGYVTEHPEMIADVVGNIPGYLMRLATPGEWAGDEELSLLAQALEVNFQIFHVQAGNTIHINAPGGGPTIYLEYKPGHYNAYAPTTTSAALDMNAALFIPSKELSLAHIKKGVKLYDDMSGKPKFFNSMQASFDKVDLADFKILDPALYALVANYPEEGNNEQFLLIAQITSALLGVNVLDRLEIYTNNDYSPIAAGAGAGGLTSEATPLSFIDSYGENLKALMNTKGKGPKVINKLLIPLDLKVFLTIRLMNMLELYAKSFQMDAKVLSEIFPEQLNSTDTPSFSRIFGFQAEVRVRLLKEIKSILVTYRIEEYQNFLKIKAKNGAFDVENCKTLAKSIFVILNKGKAKGIIIPLSNIDHQIYLYVNKEGDYHLVIHNYGVAAIKDKGLARPLHFKIEKTKAEVILTHYLTQTLKLLIKEYTKDYKILQKDIIQCPGATLIEDSFRQKPQTYDNCVTYGYNNTQYYANIRHGELRHDWLIAQELALLIKRTFEARFHWPSVRLIDSSLRRLLSGSDKKPATTTVIPFTRG